MALQMIQLPWANYVAMRSLMPSNQARTNCGWSEWTLWQNHIAKTNMRNLSTWIMLHDHHVSTHFRFHSNTGNNAPGFQIQYNTMELFTACGGTYSNGTGIMSSPSYPNQYPELAGCVYLISRPNGTYINISFITMDIDCQEVVTSEGLQSDYIEMRDGKTEESPLMGRFCGNGSNVPNFMQTTQNHLRIRWKEEAHR